MAKQHSRAFTLVELLVVISIIGMLTAIVLPAVNQSIRAARRTQCMNNQKQIALAVLAYTSAKDRFPGYMNTYVDPDDNTTTYAVSWVIELLPRLEKADVYEQWALDPNPVMNDPPRVGLLVCPEDEQETLGGAALSYIANCGLQDGSTETTPYSGIFYDHAPTNPSLKVKLDDIRDGASSTLLLSENYKADVYNVTDPTTAEYLLGFVWNKAMDGEFVINTAANEGVAASVADARINAHHVGGANAAFADGSVQFLSEKIAAHIYAKLCTPHGSRVPDADAGTTQTGVISEEDLNP